MPDRPRHPKKDLEDLLRAFEAANWRVIKKSGYYKVYCPCGQHLRTVHLSPSDPYYKRNVLQWLHRQTCWHEETAP